MSEKIVRCRTTHPCDFCGLTIKKGENAKYLEFRGPRFDNSDNQIGIDFYKGWAHNWICTDEDGEPITKEPNP